MTTRPAGTSINLKASDGFSLDAYLVKPGSAPRGAIVVVQEIFGVNSHVRAVADTFASEGYVAIAPALFDRVERNVEIGYTEADIARGREIRGKVKDASAMLDIEAALNEVRGHGRVGVVGYCWGGYLAWLAACRIDGFSAAVVYYGGGIGNVLNETPRCPVLGHFGEHDAAIPLANVDEWRKRHPQHPVHTYDAGHGFNCDHRASFDAESSRLAQTRTLEFFRKHVG